MKLSFAYFAIASTVTIVAATSCTSDNARDWPYTPDSPGTDCNGDPTCLALEEEGQCNSLSLIDDSDSTCAEKLKKLKRAVDLDCTSNESCFFFVDNSLLCLDQSTGEYHDDVGGSGNAINGVYTAPDGNVQTVTGVTAEPTSTATATRDSETATATTTRASASQTATGAAAASSSSSASSASSQNSAASQSATSSQSAASQSASSQSASAAQQTGAAARQVIGHVGVLAVAAMPIVLAVV